MVTSSCYIKILNNKQGNINGNNKKCNIKTVISGCFLMFTLSFSITFIPAFLTNRQELISRGLLAPALFLAEFLILVPLYFIFFRKREGLGRGSFRPDVFYSFLFNNDYSVICPLSAGSEENGRMDDLANVFF